MWQNFKASFKDPHFRKQAIAILFLAVLVLVLVFWLTSSIDAVSVSGFNYYVRYLTNYAGTYYPTNVSDGLLCSSGSFYVLANVSVVDSNNQSVLSSPYYYTFSFDLSSLNFSYDYEIMIYALSNTSVSFDGFLTTAYTFSSSDPQASFSRTRYNDVVFSPSGVSYSSISSANDSFRYYSFPVNSNLNNSELNISFKYSSSPGIRFGFIISVAGTDFQQLLYRSGVISSSADYLQLIDDTRSALAAGDISSDQASIILDNASDSQSQIQITHITEAQNAMNNIISLFISSSSGLSGEDLAEAYSSYNKRLYDVVLAYTGVIVDPSEGSALADLYDVAADQLKFAYQDLVNINYFNSLSSADVSYQSYSDTHDYIIDQISSVNLANSLNITTWADTLTESEKTSFRTLLNSFLSNFSWSIFLQVPLYLTLVITLLGTARSKEE